ncbi:MAG TPA: ribosomal-processing cysteine protease Prp, partial [Erysipelotrichaceae bacterium]|nr:ribosomal-processing cysteine protease Prp [Erysipelotrichaceae bacterium]
MIHVRVVRKNHLIQSITVTGHADSDVYGHDLVCAIVSGIMTG